MYDRERYEQVRRIAAEMISTNGDADEFEAVFAAEAGHATRSSTFAASSFGTTRSSSCGRR
jgi:hypothetical protein